MGKTYNQLLSEKHFLKVQQRAQKLNGVKLQAIYYDSAVLTFKTISGTDHRTIWTQTVHLEDLDVVLTSERRIDMALRGTELKVNCNCPAFQYWGFKYIAWKKGYGIEKEIRRPKVRNPYQKGTVCKHLYQVMQVYPFLVTKLQKILYAEKLRRDEAGINKLK